MASQVREERQRYQFTLCQVIPAPCLIMFCHVTVRVIAHPAMLQHIMPSHVTQNQTRSKPHTVLPCHVFHVL